MTYKSDTSAATVVDEAQQPRLEIGSSARSALVTVLGEFVAPYRRPVRTAALLYALTGMGYGEAASRQAIARAGASQLLTAAKDGRETKWEVTDEANALFTEGARRVFADDAWAVPWDGRWLVLIAPVSESRRAVRKKLYAALHWAGFGNPSPGLWVTPHIDRIAEAKKIIESLDLSSTTFCFVGSPASVGVSESDIVDKSWDIEMVADAYSDLLAAFDGREFDWGEEAFFAHLELVDSIRRTPYIDPHLPETLVPHWRGLGAVEKLRELRIRWTPAAHAHWLTIARLD